MRTIDSTALALSHFLFAVLILFSSSHLIAAQSRQVADRVLVLEGATLLSPERSDPLIDSLIILRGNRIESVAKSGSGQYPSDAHVLNLRGKYIIPGLIDTHVHYQGYDSELFLANGITAILEQSSDLWVMAVREGIAKGKIRAPRMFVSNRRLHGSFPEDIGFLDMWGNGVVFDSLIDAGTLREIRDMDRDNPKVTSPAQGRDLVRELVRKGADAIKVHHDLDRDVLKAITEEAHRAGVAVVGHRIDAREIVELGMDFIEHTAPIAIATITDQEKLRQLREGKALDPHYLMNPASFPDLIQKLVKNNVYFNPTLSGAWRGVNRRRQEYEREVTAYFSQPALNYFPPERVQKYLNDFALFERITPEQARILEGGYQNVEAFMRAFADAGGKLLAGSDPVNTGIPGLGIHQEMELMVDAGIRPIEALKSATMYAAQLLHKEKDLGTVEAGKLADLVVLSGNPLTQIENTQKVETVILDGKLVDTTFHPDFQLPVPRPGDPASAVVSIPARVRLDQSTPAVAVEGIDHLEIELKGKFLPSSKVRFNDTEISSTFESPHTLRATIPSRLLQRVGTYPIQVINPLFRGGTDKSNIVFFIVKYR